MSDGDLVLTEESVADYAAALSDRMCCRGWPCVMLRPNLFSSKIINSHGASVPSEHHHRD